MICPPKTLDHLDHKTDTKWRGKQWQWQWQSCWNKNVL